MSDRPQVTRFWEIDFIRGIAIVCTIVFHFVWDLVSFGTIEFDLSSLTWQIFGKSIGFTFVFILGLSLTLSQRKEFNNNKSVWRKFWRRGLVLLGLGLIVTIATYFIFDRQYVRFGILHLLGTSIILAYFFLNLSWRSNLAIGLILIVSGNYFLTLGVGYPWLLPFGLMPWNFNSVDYYPIMPWFGVVLLGISAGNSFYPQGQRKLNLDDYSDRLLISWTMFLGRHSLAIYLLHQPIIFGLLLLVMGN